MQRSGKLSRLLIEKRIASLKKNFSDRLLNIMGNYFSKIGTSDVMVNKVLHLYKKIYPSNFFLSGKDLE